MKRGLVVNLALCAAVTLLLLGGLEGGARLLERRRPARPAVADYIWDWDDKMPGGFYVMKSDSAGWPPWEEFNRDGLRDRTRPHEKPDLVRRVAVLGDSVTLGAEIRPDEAYPQVLEARLAAQGRAVEVMNVALWGWSTRQERTAWQRVARRYRPDVAILAVCLNDIPELQNNLARPPAWLASLHASSALVRRLVNAEGREIDSVERLFEAPDSRRVREALERFFSEVRALRAEVESDGATLSVIVFPFRFQVQAKAPRPVVQERIAAFCSAEGLRCLDLLPALRPLGAAAFVDYDHLTPAGAARTADALVESGLLPVGAAAAELLLPELARSPDPGAASASAWLRSPATRLPAGGAMALSALLRSGVPDVRRAAAWALGRAGAAGQPGRESLENLLRQDASTAVRAAVATALGAIHDRASSGSLLGALDDPSEAVRHAAAHALAALGPQPPDAPRLVAELDAADSFVAAFAAWTLGNLGEAARPAVPALARALARDDTEAVVSGALARIGPAAVEAVPTLEAALRSADPYRRWRAARTLGRIGPPAGVAAPLLVQALRDDEALVRLHAARALGRIGPAGRQGAAALQRATGDPDEGVRREARQALEKLQ